MATSASEDAASFTFWPDRDQPRPGLRPARGIALRQTTIRPFKIVKDWSSPASSQPEDDDDKRKPDTRVSSKVSQSSTIHGSPASVVHDSPQPGSLPEEEQTQTDIHASVPDADPAQRRKSGRASKARSEWWKASPGASSSTHKLTPEKAPTPPNGTHVRLDSRTTQQKNKKGSDRSSTAQSESVKRTGRKKQQRQQSFQQDESDSSSARTTRKKAQKRQASFQSDSGSVRTTGKKNQQSFLPEDSDSSTVRNPGKKRQQRSSSFPPDDSDSASVTTSRKKKPQSIEPAVSDSGSVQTTGKKKRQGQQSFQPDEPDTSSVRTTGRKKQQSFQPEDSDSSTVRNTGKKRQQRSSSFPPDDSDSASVTTSRKKKQQSIEPAVSDSGSVQTTGKKKRQRQQSFQPDESDSSSGETIERKKRRGKENSQAEDSGSSSATRKRRQQSIAPEDSDLSSVRTTTKKKRQRQQSFLSDESDSGFTITGKEKQQTRSFQQSDSEPRPTRTTGKKKKQTQPSSVSSKKVEKTRPSSQRTPVQDMEESNVPSVTGEVSMQRTRRVSKSPTEWWKVTGINGSDNRNGLSSSSDENQSVPRGLRLGESSGSSGGYRGMKTPRSQGQGDANNLVSGITRRVVSKRPPIPPQHTAANNATKGQTVYQWNAGGLERNLSDLSDLDVMLTMIEDLTQQYQDTCGDSTESSVCEKMMTQFRDKVIGAIQRKMDLVHKCKFDQSRLRKLDMTIKQRRSELLSLQREDISLDQQLDQLQKKLTGSTEREQILQNTSAVLTDLQELQQKYMNR